MDNQSDWQARLRDKAKEYLVHKPSSDLSPRSSEEFLLELQVHQVELEVQNETLRQSQIFLEESRDSYAEFYDFAPVGYITLTKDGMIQEVNLTFATMLGLDRRKLISRRFSTWVADEDRDQWHRHFMHVLHHDGKQSSELRILLKDGRHFYAHLDSLRLLKDGKSHLVRIVLSDITERRMAEVALRESEKRRL